MIKKRKFSGFPVLNLAILMVFLLAGCERDAVSYTVASSGASSAETGTEVTDLSDPEDLTADASDAGQEVSDPEEFPPAEIQVYVCGAVASPGVYVLPEGSRVYEAVEMAGGLLESADPKALNQARPLADGEQTAALGECMVYAQRRLLDGKRDLRQVVDELERVMEKGTLSALCESSSSISCMAMPRKQEIFACFNRYRGLKLN